MLRTIPQHRYYMGVIIPRITNHFNAKKKRWYMIDKWKPEYTHNWMKRYYFSDRSTKEIEWDEFEDIMRRIRMDFSRHIWIPEPNGSNEAPEYQ